MSRYQDHPVFASDDALQPALSAAEVRDVRMLLAKESQRKNSADMEEVSNADQGKFAHPTWAKRIYLARRERDRLFDDGLFADPAWDLLLDLFVRANNNEQITVSSACLAASVPEATALRYLKALTEKNYVERITHPTDKRSTTLILTPRATTLMIKWLDSCRSLF